MGDTGEGRRDRELDTWSGRSSTDGPGVPVAATAEPSGPRASATGSEGAQDRSPEADGLGLSGASEELDSLFRLFFHSAGPVGQVLGRAWRPPTDVFETADEVVVKMEAAGVSKKELSVTFDQQCLLIRGRREERFPEKKVAVSQMEVAYGAFERKLPIRHPVDPENIDATYTDGFLIIRLPKTRRRRRGAIITVVV